MRKWKPPVTTQSEPVIVSLAKHLFEKYPVPKFMYKVWTDTNKEHLGWFFSLANGLNIRKLDLPLAYTKRMSHYFMQAPDNLSILQALRWGQVRGLGGDESLADNIIRGPLGTVFANDDFWSGVIAFFARHPDLNYSMINPIIDYVRAKRFPNGLSAKQNLNFSMKGKTLNSVLRGMEEWHRELRNNRYLAMKSQKQCITWEGANLEDFRVEQKVSDKKKIFRIVQLKNSWDLFEEGQILKHCVASYTHLCRKGSVSIWSLRVWEDQLFKPLVTIELNPQNQIVQARGKYNAMPSDLEHKIIQKWIVEADLKRDHYY